MKDNVRSKVLNLVSTRKGERPLAYNCQFGLDIQKLLFQNIGYVDYDEKIATKIEQTILKWIPEITKIKIDLETIENKYIFTITYAVSDEEDVVTLEFNIDA